MYNKMDISILNKDLCYWGPAISVSMEYRYYITAYAAIYIMVLYEY